MTTATLSQALPIAIVGSGPVGLAAAAHCIARGLPVKLYEAGETVASYVRSWGHVRLFSPWRFNIDPVAAAILRTGSWEPPPPEKLPTGDDLWNEYLRPLAETPQLTNVIETGARVRTITRDGLDKVVSRGRADRPFALLVETSSGVRIDVASIVIDASGTWGTPNPIGASGTKASGEDDARDVIAYGIPDVCGREREIYAGMRVLVVGGGHSAANALLDLARIAKRNARARLTWAARSQTLKRVFGGGAADRLPARGRLGSELRALVESGCVQLVLGFSTERVDRADDGITVTGRTPAGMRQLGPVDRIIVASGLRPDLSLTRELRLDLDPVLESARALGPMIDPNVHWCGSVPPHGYRELAHPETGYFTVGMKSYGRAPTFLMATGYEQVRSVVAHVAGDERAANELRLVLPETGVCSTSLAPEQSQTGCCGGPAPEHADACCARDAEAKADGQEGCGCSPMQTVENASCGEVHP